MSRPARFGAILVLVLSGTLSCNWVGPRVFRVPTGAMEPTIKAADLVLVMLWPAGNSKVGCGDIIVFREDSEHEPG